MLRGFRFCLLLIVLGAANGWSQPLLSLEEAIQVGLQENLGLKTISLQTEAATINEKYSKAALLPTLSLSGVQNFSVNNLRQEFANPNLAPINRRGAKNTNGSLSIGLNWTLFDGFGMFIALDQLKELKKQGQEMKRVATENLASEIAQAWFNAVQQEIRMGVLEENLITSKERRNLSKYKYEAGTGSKLEYLNALVDLNADSVLLVRQNLLVKNAYADLNFLLNRDLNLTYRLPNEMQPAALPSLSELKDQLFKNNARLQWAKTQLNLGYLQKQQVQAGRYPTVFLSSGYNIGGSTAQAGLIKSTHTNSFTYGAGFQWNLLNGFDNQRQMAQSMNQISLNDNEKKRLEKQLENELQKTYNQYLNASELLALEKQNWALAKQNQESALERYKIGVATPLEVREAQQNAFSANSRWAEAGFQVKLNEIELLRLSGRILGK